MAQADLWKYCTTAHCREMLLSLHLLGSRDWPEEKIMGCLYALSNHPESHYRKARIPKRSGGFRTLLAPDPLLKTVQKNILRHVLDGFTVSGCAAAYHRGASVAANAGMHRGKKLVMKMDIEDFFGSITFPMVLQYGFPACYFPTSVGTLLASLCCCCDRLPQGAPTSPAISNLVMKPFDEYMENWCGEREITYSRYCDDMTFSGDFDASEVKGKVYGFLRSMGFEPNRKKTCVFSRGTRQVVTGMVVNERVQVPAPYRRGIRQEIYYCMKYGPEEHLRRTGRHEYLKDGNAGIRRYLESLLGRVSYVLVSRPEDRWFKEARGRLKSMILRAGEGSGAEWSEMKWNGMVPPLTDDNAADSVPIRST